MLSRTGWDETPLPVACQTVEGRRAQWGCAAGAPYRGTASPPPPPPLCVCVCVSQTACLSVWLSVRLSLQKPASIAVVPGSNRPQPLWQPPPTACLTASGAASEVPALPMHPWGRVNEVMPTPLPTALYPNRPQEADVHRMTTAFTRTTAV